MIESKFYGSSVENLGNFLEHLEQMKTDGNLRCLVELRRVVDFKEVVWAYGVNGIVEWSRAVAQSGSDLTQLAVVRGDGWSWEIESIEWLGAASGTFQFAGYATLDGKLERVRLIWQMIW